MLLCTNTSSRARAHAYPPCPSPLCCVWAAGEVIVFASQRAKVDALVAALQKAGARAAGIHGDMDQVGVGTACTGSKMRCLL